MKAAELTGLKQFDISDKSKPTITRDTDILVKINRVGVCGSDIHYFSEGKIGDQIIDFPFIVGHEAMGTIEQIGSKVKGMKVGQRIAIEPSVSCMECDQCKSGRYHTCRNNLFLGCPGQLEGALQDYIILNPSNCIPVSEHVSDDEAVLAEPLSIGLYSVKRSGIQKGQTAAILGFGPIGHSVFLCLKAQGIIPKLVTEKLNYRKKIAEKEGAVLTTNTNDPSYQDLIKQYEKEGIDIAYECCGEQEAIEDAIRILNPGGKLVIVGIPEALKISIPIHTLRRKEIDIINIRRQLNCVEEVIELMENKKIDVSNMVTHQFKLNETQKAFDMVANYQNGVMKAMINI